MRHATPAGLVGTRASRHRGSGRAHAGGGYRFEPILGDGDICGATPRPVPLLTAEPNPFAGRTTLTFESAEAASARLTVNDVHGREVATLVNGGLEAGRHEVNFESAALAAGTYV